MLEHLDSLAQTAATAISNIRFDKVVVWDGGNGQGAGNFLQNMARTLPPMMQVMRDIGGVELPDFLGKLAPDAAGARPTTAEVERALSSPAAPPSPDDRERSVPPIGERRAATEAASKPR
jgi:flotillin